MFIFTLTKISITDRNSFGQEQVPIPAISALSNLGTSGEAATLAGGDISTLLAAANPCAKVGHPALISCGRTNERNSCKQVMPFLPTLVLLLPR